MNGGADLRLPVRAVSFDLDGTLVDSIPDLAAAADAMLRELGRPALGVEVVRDYVGKGIHNLVNRCLAQPDPPDETLHAVGVEAFRRHYHAINGREATIYPGVKEGLEAFRAMGLPLACVTNKPAAFTLPLLDMLGLRRYFAEVVSGDTLAEKKPHPLPLLHLADAFGVAPAALLHIGDSVNDVQCAQAAGCRVFCVPYGYNEGGDVRALACDAIVATLVDAARRVRPANAT